MPDEILPPTLEMFRALEKDLADERAARVKLEARVEVLEELASEDDEVAPPEDDDDDLGL
jgi:hypothetical protein